jgi:ABC-type multidrug transport system fused ATPase/permease subunit
MQQPEEGATAVEKIPDEVSAGEQVSSTQEKIAEKNYDSGSTLSGIAKDNNGSKTALSLDDDAIFAHLPQHEKDILKKQLDAPLVKISFFGLYRYASKMDILILLVSAICAIAAGAALPLFTILFGSLTTAFQGIQLKTMSYDDFYHELTKNVLYFVYLGIAEFVTVYISTVGFIYTGEHITQKIREQYLEAILRQNIAYFDKLGAGEVTTRITADTNLIQDGVSEKVGLTLTALATFVTAFIVAYVKYAPLAGICTSSIVTLVLIMGGGSQFIVKYSKLSLESYGAGGTVAEEVISSIRNATAFGTQDKLAKQYEVHLRTAERWGMRLQMALGVMVGGMFGIMFLNYGLGFWMGSRYLVEGKVNVGQVYKEEWKYLVIGLIFSCLAGGGQPTQAFLYAKAISALSLPKSEYAKLRSDANFWSLMFLVVGIVQFITFSIHGVAFAFCSERLIRKARSKAFRVILRQDINFFDREENSTGALTSFLSTETKHLSGISGQTLGTILMTSTTLIAAIVISLSFGWKLALVCISVIPILLGCGFYRFYMLAAFQARSKLAYEGSASYACEATSAIRTVASLTRENDVWGVYHDQLEAQARVSLISVIKSSTLYAASQAMVFFCVALGFWYGGTLLGHGEYDTFRFFVCFSEILFGAQSAGTVFSFSPDMGKAKNAAYEFRKLFDRRPVVDTWSEEGTTVDHVDGEIEFRDVHFRYPTRPEQPVLRGLNLSVKPGQYIALVGPSGCGKSTTIALLERFYDALSGGVFVDGHNIADLNVNSYRGHLALVSQEPTLYQGTIKDNILLGIDQDDVPEDELVKACKDANIYDFIMSLPEGFNTVVGNKGGMLSGGQKQRVAIARALLRNPKILLLDEATSALDSESEKVVQAALDAAAKGRTTIAVAHRLSTIQKADIIYVFDQGKIVESGTHAELLRNQGRYYELVNMQSLGKTH